jgi:CHAT domain-containing protein
MTWLRAGAFACAVFAAVLGGWTSWAQAQSGTDRTAALGHLERGTAAFRGGDMAAAAQAWSEALRLAQQARDPEIAAQALTRRGELYRTQGYLRNALDDLRSAVAAAQAVGDERLLAAASGALGNLELAERRPEAAEPLLRSSRDLARRTGDWRTLAASQNDLGNLLAQTGRETEAASAYADAIASAAAARDEPLAATGEINAARLAFRRNDAAGALLFLQRAVGRLERSPPSHSSGMALVSAAMAALDGAGAASAERRALAERALRAAQAAAAASRQPELDSLVRGGFGKLYAQAGRVGEAAHATDQAVFAAQQGPAPELLLRWEWQRARLARQQGQVDAALASYRRGVAALQSVRQDIPVEYHGGQSSYRTTFGPLYLEFTDLLLRRAAADPARAPALIREARDTVEQLKESELQDYFRDSCVTSFEARRQSIDTVAPGAAVLYPISLPDRIELLVSFGTEQRQFTIPVGQAALRQEVRQFRELLEKRTTNQYLVPARLLYDQLIRPIEPLLAQHRIDTLVVVPDPVLRVIPFAALHDGRNFLVERYATAVAPSLHLIDPKPLAAGPRVALIMGVSQGVQGFVSLPNVASEVNAVHQLEGGKAVLNQDFTTALLSSELRNVPYNIVHLASHGQFSSDPKQTFVLAYDGKLDMDELERDIKYGERREKSLELLVLSACETASGDDRAALGLAGVALKAGARSALASLWYVSDEASGQLVVDFYRALRTGGRSKAQALQAAQRRLIAGQQYAHPAYWAPFLLIGNWL